MLRDASALVLFGLFVDLFRSGHKSIVLDESTSVLYARMPLHDLWGILSSGDPNMGFYHLLLNGWWRLFGESEAAIRSLSALCGALAVGAIYLLGFELFNRKTGLIAGVLLALNAFVLDFAQTVRSYALLVLLITLSSLFLVRELERPSRAHRIGYLIATVLAIHAHYLAALFILAHVVALIAIQGRAVMRREWAGTAMALLLLSVPEAIFAYGSGAAAGISWIQPPSLHDIPTIFVDFAGRSEALLLVLLAAGGWAMLSSFRGRQHWRHGFLAVWLLLPVALGFAISLVKPIFLSHYLIACVPALVLLAGSGIERIRPRIVGSVVLLVAVSLSARQVVAFYERDAVQDWRGATHYVLDATQVGDGIVFFPGFARKPFQYYVRQRGLEGPALVQNGALQTRRRVWLVIRESDVALNPTGLRDLHATLQTERRLTTRREFARVTVELYER